MDIILLLFVQVQYNTSTYTCRHHGDELPMIEYGYNVFGIAALGRVQGSALYRGILPALFSVLILLVFVYGFNHTIQENEKISFTQHVYVFQVLVVAVTYSITFRTNFAYGRVSCKNMIFWILQIQYSHVILVLGGNNSIAFDAL